MMNDSPDPIYSGYNIIELCKKYCKEYDISIDRIKYVDKHLNEAELNQFYNICDIFLR